MICQLLAFLYKVIKMDIGSPTTHRVIALRSQGMQIGQIAQVMGLSRQTVISHLPYDRGQLSHWSDDERAAALSDEDVPGRSYEAKVLQRHRIKAPQRVRHDTPLRRARLKAQLTQAELADKSGVSLSYIHDIERGRARPESMSLDMLRALSGVLGCEIKDLYETE